MGRLLPLVYGLLKKTKQNYGKVCGLLYFVNTLGTVFGAIVIGYSAFYFLNLDIVFKINLYILFLLTLSLLLYTKNKLRYTTFFHFIFLIVIGIVLIYLPKKWNRTGHEMGYFRTKVYNPEMHFQGLFFLPSQKRDLGEALFLKDGPNTTVSLLKFKEEINASSACTWHTPPIDEDRILPDTDTWMNSKPSHLIQGLSDLKPLTSKEKEKTKKMYVETLAGVLNESSANRLKKKFNSGRGFRLFPGEEGLSLDEQHRLMKAKKDLHKKAKDSYFQILSELPMRV